MEPRGILRHLPVTGRAPGARRSGFALEQVAIAMAVVAILLVAIVVHIPGRHDHAVAKQVVRDAQTIADAAVRYRWRTGGWPSSVGDLIVYELRGNIPTTNRFGSPYVISGSGYHVLVSTNIPLAAVPPSAGTGVSHVSAGGQTTVTVTRTLTDNGMAEALYSKKHLYAE